MRPTLSELGEYDGTALMEFKTKKNIIYLLHKENVCTYEMDDTPPFLVNQEAVDVAIEQCLMLGCDIVDEVHIARKQYLDGSIPTGFQRTAIVGVNGRLPFRGRELSITQVSVEEDSCREVSRPRPPDRLAHRPPGHAADRDGDRPRPAHAGRGGGGDPAGRPRVPQHRPRARRHRRQPPGRQRLGARRAARGDQGRAQGRVGAARWCTARRCGRSTCSGCATSCTAAASRRPTSIGVEQRRRHRRCSPRPRRPSCAVEGWEKYIARRAAPPRLRARRAARSACARSACKGLAGTLALADAARPHLRPRAGGPHPRHRRARPAADPAPQREVARLPRLARRSCARCGRACTAIPRTASSLVWGPEEDTVTAANEIRLRYVDAIDGHPERDAPAVRRRHAPTSSASCPGPDRMYPDTDSPPTRVTRERVERLQAGAPAAAVGARGALRGGRRAGVRRSTT